jgi:hypothetical protein
MENVGNLGNAQRSFPRFPTFPIRRGCPQMSSVGEGNQ